MPTDHEIFNKLNQGQWLWYFHNFQKDQEEDFTLRRDLVEYHASFIEPQAVQKIRDGRKNAVRVEDNQFAQNIESIFGRALPNSKNPAKKKEELSVDWGTVMKNIEEHRNKKVEKRDYKYWLNLEL